MTPIMPKKSCYDNQTPDRTTNRCNQSPNLESPFVGVDTIRVRGCVRDHNLSHMAQRTRIDYTNGEIEVVSSRYHDYVFVRGHRVALQADDRHGGSVSFELSVPRVFRGTNEVAASIEEVIEVVQRVHHAASYRVHWIGDWTALEVLRVDLVRGFEDVTDISTTIHRLSTVPQARGRLRKVFNDPARGDAQTLTVGTPRRWLTTAYDKPAEMLHAASKTNDTVHAEDLREKALLLQGRRHLRVETSVRARPLKERLGSNRLVELLEEDAVNTTVEHYFKAVGLDTPVGGVDKIIRALQEMSEDSKDQGVADRVIAMLFREANGIPQAASRNSLETYNGVARRSHLSAADFYQRGQSSMHLDWDRGIQVIEAAA